MDQLLFQDWIKHYSLIGRLIDRYNFSLTKYLLIPAQEIYDLFFSIYENKINIYTKFCLVGEVIETHSSDDSEMKPVNL